MFDTGKQAISHDIYGISSKIISAKFFLSDALDTIIWLEFISV